MSRATSRATCRGTQTRGVGKVVDDERRNEPRDEPVRRGVVDDER
jgi:hypothetical protein